MRSPNELVPLPKFRDFREKKTKNNKFRDFRKKVLNEKKFSSRPPATLSLGSGTPNESYPSAALMLNSVGEEVIEIELLGISVRYCSNWNKLHNI